MICPLTAMKFMEIDKETNEAKHGMECIYAECAWWSEACKMCAVKAISCDIGFIAGTLGNIETKMPHERQFRR